jgi:hypothetical protein
LTSLQCLWSWLESFGSWNRWQICAASAWRNCSHKVPWFFCEDHTYAIAYVTATLDGFANLLSLL